MSVRGNDSTESETICKLQGEGGREGGKEKEKGREIENMTQARVDSLTKERSGVDFLLTLVV